MHTEIVLRESGRFVKKVELKLTVRPLPDGSGAVVELWKDGGVYLSLTLSDKAAEVQYVRDGYELWAMPGHVCLLELEAEMPPEPDEPGAGESPFAGAVPSWLSGPEPDESAGEMPSLLSGIRRAPAEPDLAVWGEAIADALRKSDERGEQNAI